MTNIANPSTDFKPDLYSEPCGDGSVTLVANQKAREVLARGFDKPGPRWGKVKGSRILRSPEYRTLGIESGPVPGALLGTAHRAGLLVIFLCAECSELHNMTDELAERFLKEAMFAAEGVHPAPGGVQ
jgi:hypothetical protein